MLAEGTMALKCVDLLNSHSYKHPQQFREKAIGLCQSIYSWTFFLRLSACPVGYHPAKQICVKISHGKASTNAWLSWVCEFCSFKEFLLFQSPVKWKVPLPIQSKYVCSALQDCIWLLKMLNKLCTTDGECLLHVSQSSQEHCLGKDEEMRKNQAEQNNPWSTVMETA